MELESSDRRRCHQHQRQATIAGQYDNVTAEVSLWRVVGHRPDKNNVHQHSFAARKGCSGMAIMPSNGMLLDTEADYSSDHHNVGNCTVTTTITAMTIPTLQHFHQHLPPHPGAQSQPGSSAKAALGIGSPWCSVRQPPHDVAVHVVKRPHMPQGCHGPLRPRNVKGANGVQQRADLCKGEMRVLEPTCTRQAPCTND